MDIKDLQKNKKNITIAVLVIILIIGVGIISYSGDFGVNVPTERPNIQSSSTSGQVSLNILPNPENQGGNNNG